MIAEAELRRLAELHTQPAEPYRGLEPFRFADSGILAARDAEIERLVRLTTMYRGVLLYGESGAGKSSMVNAGLLPRAMQHGWWPHRVRVQPRAEQEFVLEPIRSAVAKGEFVPSAFADAGADGRLVLGADAFLPAAAAAAADGRRLLIVFDQFEELVTLFDGDREALGAQARVVAAISRALRDQDVRIKLLFVFREDYLASLEPLLAEHPELNDQGLRLVSPPAGCAASIIRAPFERFPFEHELTPSLAERLEALLAERSRTGALNLSELQVVCQRLWSADDPAALLHARGVEGLLEDFLEHRLGAFTGEPADVAVASLTRLVTESGTRNVVSREDLLAAAVQETGSDVATARDVLRRLDESRLVRTELRRDVVTYEIVSEFLVPHIADLKAERAASAEAAKAREAADRLHAEETADRRRRLGRIGGVVGLFVLVIIAGLAVYAWQQRNDALVQRDAASHSENLAKANELSAMADSLVNSDPRLAQRLALTALKTRWAAQSENALRAAVARPAAAVTLASPEQTTNDSCCVSFSADGTRVVALIGEKARIWDARDGRIVATIDGVDPDTAPQISENSRVLTVLDHDSISVRVVDVRDGKPIRRLRVPSGTSLMDATVSRDGTLVAATAYSVAKRMATVRVWSVATGGQLGQFSTAYAAGVHFSRDGGAVITRGIRGISAFDVARGRMAWHIRGAYSFTVAPGGQVVAVLTTDGVRLLDADSGALRRRLPGSRKAAGLIFAPGGRFLAGEVDGRIVIWDARGGDRRASLAKRKRATEFALVGDGSLLATAEAGQAVLTDVRTGARVLRFGSSSNANRPASHVSGLTFSSDGTHLATTGDDGQIRLWDIPRLLPRVIARVGWQTVWCTAISPHNDRFAAVTRDGMLSVFAMPSGRRLYSRRILHDPVWMVTFSPDGERVATSDAAGNVKLWDADTGARIGPALAGGRGWASAVDFAPDGQRLAAAVDSRVIVWDLRSGRRLASMRAGTDLETVAFSPDGTSVAAGDDDGVVYLFDLAKGTRRYTLTPGYGQVNVVAFSPDGRSLAVGTDNGAALVFDVHTRRRRSLLIGAPGSIRLVAFARQPDDRHLLTAGTDGTVRLWDWRPQTGAVVATGVREAASVALSPDRAWLTIAGTNHTVQVVACPGCAPLDALEQRAGRTARVLTTAERTRYEHAGEHPAAKPF